jgi:two-component system sensor histidine kinase RegB
MSRLREASTQNEWLAVLGRLVGSMSHELNTPLATIALQSRELQRFRSELGEHEVEEIVASIVRESERANEIVGLVRGHVQSDQIAEPVELAELVGTIAREELDRLGFEGERRFELEQPLVVPVLRRPLVQILVNLLRNATEASLIGRQRIVVTVRRVDGAAEIAVEDRGPGFRPEVLARLGEPFQTTKSARGGMGLGLYVCARLARQMGAALSVQSLRGRGARVVVRLPELAADASA